MHDPMTVAFEFEVPILGLVTIWHVDPETDGTDDSCGWFMRARHGDKEMLAKIERAFDFDWDRKFVSEIDGRPIPRGLFYPAEFLPNAEGLTGQPAMSTMAITLNLFWTAAYTMFGAEKANRFMRENLWDILYFAENPCDSLADSIQNTFGKEDDRKARIHTFASVIYSWILRVERPWYQHPRWHVWHWRVQVVRLQLLRRWLFSRCGTCGKGFKFGEHVVSNSWGSKARSWFTGEPDVHHMACVGIGVESQEVS